MIKDQKSGQLALAVFKTLEPAELLFHKIVEEKNYEKRIEMYRVTTNDFGVTMNTLLLKSSTKDEGLVIHSLHIKTPMTSVYDDIF